jgi:hypothetical protein
MRNKSHKALKYKFFLIVAGILLSHYKVDAQCGLALKELTMQEIGNVTYLKDFRVRLPEGKNPKKAPLKEFSILLNKGTHYRFNVKADTSCTDQVILKLYDFTKYYGGNYDPDDGTSYEYFDFFCSKTQVYYLSMSFAKAKAGCAVTIVSFVDNYNAN